jgi:hypothetical protein
MTRATLPTPIEPKAFAVPRDHGFWFDDAKSRFPVRPHTQEPNPEKTIKGRQLESPFLVPALENEKLMAQGEDFSLQSNPRPERITKSGGQENQDREHHQSLLPHRAKCHHFSENEFLVGTGSPGPSQLGSASRAPSQ